MESHHRLEVRSSESRRTGLFGAVGRAVSCLLLSILLAACVASSPVEPLPEPAPPAPEPGPEPPKGNEKGWKPVTG